MKDLPSAAVGKDFTPGQRMSILGANMKASGGRLRSDVTGRYLSKPGTRLPNSAQIDHILPKSRGGANSYSNAQVVEAVWNQSKGNR